ncbi:MAG: hypothetical protein HGA85_06660, partial [Nanoarchaeota archaeon]|nr:hypothetical protein [Nanoarchaeota archaeon]
RYPGLYKVLIEDRNRHIAKGLVTLSRDNPNLKILAVVGAGHIEGIHAHLLRMDPVANFK